MLHDINNQNQKKILISIIIPIFNSEEFLGRLMESIAMQIYDNYEVIAIDDGSSDASVQLANSYEGRIKNLEVHKVKHSGPGAARKFGFSKSKGQLLFFIDSDDALPDEHVLSKIAETYQKTHFEIMFFDFYTKMPSGTKVINAFDDHSLKKGWIKKEYACRHTLRGALWSKIFVKEKMYPEFFIETSNYEDYYTTYRCLDKCNRIYYTDDILYSVDRGRVGSLSKNNRVEKITETVDVLVKLYEETAFKMVISILSLLNYVYGIAEIRHSQSDNVGKKEFKEIQKLRKIVSENKRAFLHVKIKYAIAYTYYCLLYDIGRIK